MFNTIDKNLNFKILEDDGFSAQAREHQFSMT